MNPQLSSKLLALALELRQAIYSLLLPYRAHASICQGNIVLSACVQPCTDLSIVGHERKPLGDALLSDTQRSLYQQRLCSTWGPYWECEGVALGFPEKFAHLSSERMNFLKACRRAKTEMVDFLMNIAPMHVAGLDDLQYLLQEASRAASKSPDNVNNTLATAFARVHHLHIVLRLPLCTFKKIDRHHSQPSVEDSSDKATSWLRLCPALASLSQLRTLRLWVDHDSSKSWTIVNERAFLAPLEPLIVSKPDLKVSVSLPKLHPRWESSARHFVPGCVPPPYTIDRRLRQWFHVVQTRDGRSYVRCRKDFPILFEDNSSDDSLETVEREERQMWEAGEDVYLEIQRRTTVWVNREESSSSSGSNNSTSDEKDVNRIGT